ncbi:RND family efflux transporter, MFP subunit [Granulicella rosea]|uniref:RND family efflux transporter, MFP subunit n=1 Tax=Granulicella rosea TaxID=474952 RepID=A0A239M1A2_9BACT|nr:efflux RND transporter periplasmic adaptor subunit [Granulicella rosea]SNT36310.1 RND family efflux transporter, MFP subunit [Granulicella rosea]
MEQQQNMHDTREGGVPPGHDAAGHQIQTEPPIQLDLDRKLGSGPIFGLGAAFIVLAIFIFLGIRSRANAEQTLVKTTDDAAIRDVSVIKPTQGSKALEIVLPANTQAFIDTPIYARTNGYLRRWYADIGAHVRQGQVLADIETPELDQQVQQAQSDLATATSNLHIAEITAERWKKLLAKDAVSKQESDQANSDLTARTSAVASAQANVRRLQQMQGFEKIVAPFDGTITARNVDVGALIQGGDSGTAKSELFHMASTDKLRLFVPVPEVYAASVKNGEQIEVTSDASPDLKIAGTVVRTSDSIDIASRTLNVEVDVNNADHKLLTGQYAFIHLPIPPSSSSLTVPAGDVLFRGEGLRIGVVRDGHVELVPVKIGHDYGATVEIVSGLSPQDLIIQNPSDSLAQGERVRVESGARE